MIAERRLYINGANEKCKNIDTDHLTDIHDDSDTLRNINISWTLMLVIIAIAIIVVFVLFKFSITLECQKFREIKRSKFLSFLFK